ncbi:MAG: CRISPR-associated helicase Cas3' [Ignavibacteriaceae bacterium]|nr:CRISPR-associated helicase Cas3' [Ignavibacteriaceae bacterium]
MKLRDMVTSPSFDTKSVSHPPDEQLGHHLHRVALNSDAIAEKVRPVFTQYGSDIIRAAQMICAVLHDAGKSTSYFQDYILRPEKPFDRDLKAHAHISALLALKTAEKYFESRIPDPGRRRLLCFIIYIVVKRHHGDLRNFRTEFSSISDKSVQETLALQAEALSGDDLDVISSLLEHMIPGIMNGAHSAREDFTADHIQIQDLRSRYNIMTLPSALKKLNNNEKLELYFLLQYLYAALLYSDKKDVILKGKEVSTGKNFSDSLFDYRRRKFGTEPKEGISGIKEKVFTEIIEYLASNFDPEFRFYSITLPTGLGKTIASYAAALKIGELTGSNKKVIICIPFTSIIDQNYTVYEEITGGRNDSSLILKHHHLTEPGYKTGDETLSPDKSTFLIETWESDLVITTFVQFFESIITNSKSRVLKIPNMAHSVIILDEIQNIPYKLWKPVNAALMQFAKIYDCYFILLTATQPLIFEPGKEIRELVRNHDEYFKVFNRTVIKFPERGFEFENPDDLKSEITFFSDSHPEKNILVILNTKNAARKLFEELDELIKDKELYYLSTLITPCERKQIIERIKEKTSGNNGKIIAVSTQLVEAGVDISFDVVFREMAPLDSILQSAGRANRYNENPFPAEVYLFRFSGRNDFSSIIYGVELIEATNSVIREGIGNFGLFEKRYLSCIDHYFRRLKNYAENLEPALGMDMADMNFDELAGFSLIDDTVNTAQAYIILNDEAGYLWDEYVRIYNLELQPWEKKEEFKKIRNRFYDYVINVPVRKGGETALFNKEPEHGFFVWRSGEDEFYSYDPENFRLNKGFIKITSGVL